jgi:flavodoxin
MAEKRVGRPTSLIVCVSEHHGNTRAVAEAMAAAIGAEVRDPEAVDLGDLGRYDLVGFGSGIYVGVVHPRLIELVDRLPPGEGRSAFTFSTSGMFLLPWLGTSDLRNRLRDHGYRLLDDFNCRGLDTVGPLRFVGGLNRGRPDARDLARATQFARDMQRRAARPPRARSRATASRPA